MRAGLRFWLFFFLSDISANIYELQPNHAAFLDEPSPAEFLAFQVMLCLFATFTSGGEGKEKP